MLHPAQSVDYLLFLFERVCDRALAATLLDFGLYLLSRRILEALLATLELVCFLLPIKFPPSIMMCVFYHIQKIRSIYGSQKSQSNNI